MASLAQIKDWFRTGLKPTQTQFWITWDSFWHKDTPIPQSAIHGLEEALASTNSGGRFGIEDNAMDSDRNLDMKAHDFNFSGAGEVNFSGAVSLTKIPYDEAEMFFEQDNGYNESRIYLPPISRPVNSTLTATIDVDGVVSDYVFGLYMYDESIIYQLTPAITGTSVTLLSITKMADTSVLNIGMNTTEISPGSNGHFSINGNFSFSNRPYFSEGVDFQQINNSGYADLDGYTYIKFYFTWADEPYVPETIAAVINVDGIPTDMVFTRYFHEENGNYWVVPQISGATVELMSYMEPTHIPAKVLMDIPGNDGERNGAAVYIDQQGLYTSQAFNPSLNDVAQQGSTINYKDVQLLGSYGAIGLYTEGYGPYFPNIVVSGVNGSWPYVQYSNSSISFRSQESAVTLQMPNSTGGMLRSVTLPRISGHIPVKTELYELSHKTYTVTASTMTDSQWNDLVLFDDTSGGGYKAAANTLIYNGTANATWNIPVESANDWIYTIINNTNYTITITRGGITTLWLDGVSNTSVVIPAKGWADIVGSKSENRFYFKIK